MSPRYLQAFYFLAELLLEVDELVEIKAERRVVESAYVKEQERETHDQGESLVLLALVVFDEPLDVLLL